MSILIEKTGAAHCFPMPREFIANPTWPSDLGKLFSEAAGAFAAESFTAAAMTARKILMAVAVAEGEADGKSFAEYVGFITTNVLSMPRAKSAIDAIRTIGNDSNHKIAFVNRVDAHRALTIVRYLLDTVYALPHA